ncbi:MAG: ParB/RepB/Spo0J family partition protein [Chloroflexota bacterium]|nr:ParB/RepB/Spo0J family partition protein [Chloroflexota bacterium]
MDEQTTEEVVHHLPHTMLRIHPRNMRRFYPQHEVERMAASIEARGVIEPLIGVRVNGHVQIVVGNLRLTSARYLGDEAPLMPVIIRQQEEAEQLLDMVAENLVRAAPDPVSEALHYWRLLQEPGMSRARLARETGVASATINDRLRLMELEPEIQDLIAAGRFPRGREPVEALLSIPDSRARVETARALAKRRADVRLIKATCTRVRGRLERRLKVQQAAREGREYVPALEGALEAGLPPEDRQPIPWGLLRQAAAASCGACSAWEGGYPGLAKGDCSELAVPSVTEPGWGIFRKREGLAVDNPSRAGIPMPAWGEMAQAVESTCAVCAVRDMESVCGSCALIEFLRRVVRQINGRSR